jgi:hypothetical protein
MERLLDLTDSRKEERRLRGDQKKWDKTTFLDWEEAVADQRRDALRRGSGESEYSSRDRKTFLDWEGAVEDQRRGSLGIQKKTKTYPNWDSVIEAQMKRL